MNEQIREILSQCQLESIDGPEYPRWTDLEKFAELIVRECQYAIVSRTDLPKHERKLYNNVLKEHFGIEE